MRWRALWNLRWGNPGTLEVPNRAWRDKNLIDVELPYQMRSAYTGRFLKTITFHRKGAAALVNAFTTALFAAEARVRESAAWAQLRLHLKQKHGFDKPSAFYDAEMAPWVRKKALKLIASFGGDVFSGSWVHRYVRGYEQQKLLSPHAWGVALDLNHRHNPLGSRATTFPKWFIEAFTSNGFAWGGGWTTRPDTMHFELK